MSPQPDAMPLGNLGPNGEVTINEQGGYQSKLDYDFTLSDPFANFRLAQVLGVGARKYARDNWRLIGVDDHINHALVHINAFLAGDKQDDHLGHALCRLHMAVAKELRPDYFGAAARSITSTTSVSP